MTLPTQAPSVAVVHLVRFANGPGPLTTFLRQYEKCLVAGGAHRLVFACKGFESWDHLSACLAEWSPLSNTADQKLLLPDEGFDLGAYRRAAEKLSEDVLVFVNSFSRPLVAGWIERLVDALSMKDVGIAGATGSLEATPVEDGPWKSAFPNPHVRTNAFAIRRSLFLDLNCPELFSKEDCHLMEAGPIGFTAQILARGLRAVVVGAEGPPEDVVEARETATFRWGRQANLMVADNQTDDNARCAPGPYVQRQMATWGRAERHVILPESPPALPAIPTPSQMRSAEVIFVCPIYDMYPQILSSLICQTHPNWKLLLLHNGPEEGGGPRYPYARLRKIVDAYDDSRVTLRAFPTEQGKWGHPLRQWALEEMKEKRLPGGDFTVITNADNYYMPGFAEYLLRPFEANPELVATYCKHMVHSYRIGDHRWNVFRCRPQMNYIDCGGVMVRSSAAMAVGWKSLSFASDWDYFNDLIQKYGPKTWARVLGCLFVHN